MVRWFDHHCHLPTDPTAALAIVADAASAGVERLCNVGTDVAGSRAAAEVASRLDGVWSTAGVHPHDASDVVAGGEVDLSDIESLLDDPVVVAVGEIGLDYHYDNSPRDAQRMAFAAQLELAARRDLPVVIHAREAWDDTFAILDDLGPPRRGVLHCFTGGPPEATAALDRGLLLSFSGIVTYPSAPEVRDAAALCPLDRVLVETDSPYLAPVPKRGNKNSPSNVAIVGEAVAQQAGIGGERIAEVTWENAERFYGLS